jgi:sugar/nucleoside kinase (ribokinase family)
VQPGLVASVHPDILFATEREAEGLLSRPATHSASHGAAVILKRGSGGATVVAHSGDSPPLRFDGDPDRHTEATGAGDALMPALAAGSGSSGIQLKADTSTARRSPAIAPRRHRLSRPRGCRPVWAGAHV